LFGVGRVVNVVGCVSVGEVAELVVVEMFGVVWVADVDVVQIEDLESKISSSIDKT
jgi:hypothetical protein